MKIKQSNQNKTAIFRLTRVCALMLGWDTKTETIQTDMTKKNRSLVSSFYITPIRSAILFILASF